jgi:hypothetical protein
VHAEGLQRGLHFIQLEGFDHSGDEFHATHLSGTRFCADLLPTAFRPLSRSVSGP